MMMLKDKAGLRWGLLAMIVAVMLMLLPVFDAGADGLEIIAGSRRPLLSGSTNLFQVEQYSGSMTVGQTHTQALANPMMRTNDMYVGVTYLADTKGTNYYVSSMLTNQVVITGPGSLPFRAFVVGRKR